MVGAQYPLYNLFAPFTPESAFLLPSGSFTLDIIQNKSNSFEFSQNSEKNYDKTAQPNEFRDDAEGGYSVFLDIESRRTTYRIAIGLADFLEFQFTRSTASLSNTIEMDTFVENFHKNLGLGNYEREQANRGEFHFYIYDNDNNRLILEMSDPEPFHHILDTYAVKFSLLQGKNHALSAKITSSRQRIKSEHTADEYESESFQEKNYSLYYSLIFQPLSIHAAASYTVMPTALFPDSPNELYHYFLGVNAHLSESWDFLIQLLQYRSLYPARNEGTTNMADDVLEFTFGVRYLWNENWALDFGAVENVTQGPNNIDIAFISSLSIAY